jgi:hypothetical protein
VVLAVGEAWSLDPIGVLKIGGRAVPVPPITFARFQRLLALDPRVLIEGMAKLDVASLAPWVNVVIPEISEDEWRKSATLKTVGEAFLLFAKSHDWESIANAIALGEPVTTDDPLPTRSEIARGLLGIAQATGHTMEELSAMRIEGFYLLVDLLREKTEPQEEPFTLPAGMEIASTESGRGLLDILGRADEVSRGDG